MRNRLKKFIGRITARYRLKPLSLAAKCRLEFGAAVFFSLTLALLIPYFWMGKLTEKIAFDAGRAVADEVYERHFQINNSQEKGLPLLEESGLVRLAENRSAKWISFIGANSGDMSGLTDEQKNIVEQLRKQDELYDAVVASSGPLTAKHTYVRIVRAGDTCIRCHNPQGSGSPYNRNEPLGAIVVQTPARDVAKTVFMNRLWIVMAGLLAATGAMIGFYTITQRIILRPIRQLRAMVNNVSEGNLSVRSSIKTGDEYEKLSDAFNAMLEGWQESQDKLRQANRQLDAKIAQLSDRNIELFKANKLKSEFLANISHEFRTPLNSILGFAQLLQEKPAENIEKSKRYAENIVSSGRSLLNMINDLLELAKAESGKIELHIEKTSIQQLCEGLASFFSLMIEEKQLDMTVSVDENIPLVNTDAGKVQQILYNFVSNAIKFTPERGKIRICAIMVGDAMVRLSVSDTGPGISRENQEKIFEKFRQLDGSITRQVAGTGLGLAICRELAHLLAGGIWLESEPGRGSTFSLEIPANLSTEAAGAKQDEAAE